MSVDANDDQVPVELEQEAHALLDLNHRLCIGAPGVTRADVLEAGRVFHAHTLHRHRGVQGIPSGSAVSPAAAPPTPRTHHAPLIRDLVGSVAAATASDLASAAAGQTVAAAAAQAAANLPGAAAAGASGAAPGPSGPGPAACSDPRPLNIPIV